MEENNYYIYCIALNTAELGEEILGHNNQTVFRLEYKKLAAFVSKTALTHIEADFNNLQGHEAVIAKLLGHFCVLPMCFSTICKSEKSVLVLLQKYYDQFIKNLEELDGKVELGIKVFYRLDFEEEDKKDKELLKTPKDYMLKRYERYCNRQKKIDDILFSIEESHKALNEIASDSCYTKPLKNNLIFNASYLVSKDRKTTFDQAVEEMKKNNPTYKILYSGPWAAYHFVTIVQEGEEDE